MSEANKAVGCSYVAKPAGRVNLQTGVEAVKVEEQGDCPSIFETAWKGLKNLLDGIEQKPTNLDRSNGYKACKSGNRCFS